jgi:uncharacterized membrane protein YphA (DoxX/SURF4 family)
MFILQVVAASILIPVGILKFNNNPTDIEIFTHLGMEPHGRLIIGGLELVSGIFLLTKTYAASGAFLAVGVMLGAVLAHTTVIGSMVEKDNGLHLILLVVVLVTCSLITWVRRKQLPGIGNSL